MADFPRMISVSVGKFAVPDAYDSFKAALTHADEHPTHDPVVVFDSSGVDGEQYIWWRCMGEHPPYTEDVIKFCAQGGDGPWERQ